MTAPPRPAAPGAAITFLYYEDLSAAASFYEGVLGLEMAMDQGGVRIYRIAGSAFLGLVGGTAGTLRPQPRNAVMLTLVSEDLEGWHAHLARCGVPGLTAIRRGAFHEYVLCQDPGGYAVEVQRFTRGWAP